MNDFLKMVSNYFVERLGRVRTTVLAWLLSVGIVALIIHTLILTNLNRSALLYLCVPYGVSIIIALLRSYDEPTSIYKSYISHMLSATIFFLATSIILREGFICIIFFMPIYYLMVSVAYLAQAYYRSKNSDKLYSMTFPVLVLLMSLEGTHQSLSLPRDSYIEVSKIVPMSTAQIKDNLAKQFDLQKHRHWMLSIFPMPYRIEAGSLNPGDVHKIYTRYHRWFVSNTHYGEAELLIEDVSENRIKTKMLSDSTYFSSYVKVYGTEVTLKPLEVNRTEIKLRIDFRRRLDPAWYFHPLQSFAIEEMAEYLIKEVMIRG